MEGLHGILAMESILPVTRRVGCPIRAEISAASTPACPPPITMISNDLFMGFEIDYSFRGRFLVG